jgi:hypothetical protein
MRATASFEPPGGNGTMILICAQGYSAAETEVAHSVMSATITEYPRITFS